MIKYEIRKPKIVEVVSQYLASRNIQPPYINSNSMLGKMDKIQFAKWNETNITGKFKVDDLVTYASTPEVPNYIPVYSKIIYINELWYQCRWSLLNNGPESITVRNKLGNVELRCATTIRKLTDKETALVNLQTTEAKGTC